MVFGVNFPPYLQPADCYASIMASHRLLKSANNTMAKQINFLNRFILRAGILKHILHFFRPLSESNRSYKYLHIVGSVAVL